MPAGAWDTSHTMLDIPQNILCVVAIILQSRASIRFNMGCPMDSRMILHTRSDVPWQLPTRDDIPHHNDCDNTNDPFDAAYLICSNMGPERASYRHDRVKCNVNGPLNVP